MLKVLFGYNFSIFSIKLKEAFLSISIPIVNIETTSRNPSNSRDLLGNFRNLNHLLVLKCIHGNCLLVTKCRKSQFKSLLQDYLLFFEVLPKRLNLLLKILVCIEPWYFHFIYLLNTGTFFKHEIPWFKIVHGILNRREFYFSFLCHRLLVLTCLCQVFFAFWESCGDFSKCSIDLGRLTTFFFLTFFLSLPNTKLTELKPAK